MGESCCVAEEAHPGGRLGFLAVLTFDDALLVEGPLLEGNDVLQDAVLLVGSDIRSGPWVAKNEDTSLMFALVDTTERESKDCSEVDTHSMWILSALHMPDDDKERVSSLEQGGMQFVHADSTGASNRHAFHLRTRGDEA